MAPLRTGGIEPRRRADGSRYYRARIRLGDGSRVRVDVPAAYSAAAGGKSADERAELYAAALQEREDEFGELLAKKRAGLLGRRRRVAPTGGMATWFDAWIADRRAKGQTSTRDNRGHYEHHIAPAIGPTHVREWTTDDLRRLSRELDGAVQRGDIGWKTARNVWTTTGKMLADAVRSKRDELRCRDSNPIRDVEGPSRGVERAHQYLYPSELAAFAAADEDAVPRAWRRLVAIAVYTCARGGELRALRWEDVDLEHRVIHFHRSSERGSRLDKSTKGKQARPSRWSPASSPCSRR